MSNSRALGILRPGVNIASESVDDCESLEDLGIDVECDCQESDDAGMG